MKVKIKNKELEELYLSLMGDNHMVNLSQEDCMFLEKEYANAICCYRNYLTRPYLTTSYLDIDFFYINPVCYLPLNMNKSVASLSTKCRVMIVKREFGIKREIQKVVNLRSIALNFDVASLRLLYQEDKDKYNQIKDFYFEGFKNGGYELANNLGILAYRIEKDEYKGKEFFVLALAHESVNALKNIVTLLWNEEKYGLVYELLKKHIYDDCCDMYAQKFRIFSALSKCGFFLDNHINLTKPLMLLMPQLKLHNNWYFSVENIFYKSTKRIENDSLEFDAFGSAKFVKKCRFYVANSLNTNMALGQAKETTFIGERDFSIFKHVVVQKSESAIWDIYLLMSVKYFFISKWTEKRHLILQNSDLDFYIASNGVSLKANFEKSYFLPTVQIKDEKKGYSAHVYCCYITVDDELVREHVVMKVLDGKIISYKLADKEVYIWCDIVDDNNPLPF